MLIFFYSCGILVYCNNFKSTCSKCEKELTNILPNPDIVRTLFPSYWIVADIDLDMFTDRASCRRDWLYSW